MGILKYQNNPDTSTNLLNLGRKTVDIKSNEVFLTSNPDDEDQHFEFVHIASQERRIRTDQSRFTINIATESLTHGNDGEFNKLGEDWRKKYKKFPTINLIKAGFKKEEYKQLLMKSGLDPESKEFKEAYDGKCQMWDNYFGEITDTDHDKPLDPLILSDPTLFVVEQLLYIYSFDSWVFAAVNSGSREGDQDKVETLGPFALAFGDIITGAPSMR